MDREKKPAMEQSPQKNTTMSTSSIMTVVVSVLAWYISSSAYVEQVAAVENKHIGIHALMHAFFFVCSTSIWEFSNGNQLLKWESFVTSPSPWTTVASACHTVGFLMAILGVWYLGGTSTQMVKLLEPIVVLTILQIRQNANPLVSGQVVGSFIVIGTVTAKLMMSSTFSVPNFLLSCSISFWFPLRNTVWEKSMALKASVDSLCMALVLYIMYALYSHDIGTLGLEVIAPAALFGCYQLSSLVVLHFAQPQLHATLNIGKRCFVILVLFIFTEQFDMVKFGVYAVGLIGSALISLKTHSTTSVAWGIISLLLLVLTGTMEPSGPIGVMSGGNPDVHLINISPHEEGSLWGNTSTLPASIHSTVVQVAATTTGKPRVYVPDGYTENNYYSSPNLTLREACTRNHGGNVGNMIWQYGASSLLDAEKNFLVQGSAGDVRNAFRTEGPPALLLLPVANIFFSKIPSFLTEFVPMAEKNIMVGAGSQLFFYEMHKYPDVGEVVNKPEMVTMPLPDNVQEFLHMLADRSLLIGVRGKYTYNVLSQYEKRAIKSLGCPSLIISDEPKLGQVIAKNKDLILKSPDPAALKFIITLPVHYSPNMMRLLHGLTVRHPRSFVVLQDPRDEYILNVAASHYDMHFHNTIWFNRYGDWQKFACDADAAIGARIHGSMVAVQCGKPVFIIAPDRRVQELADVMKVPHRVSMSPDLRVNMTYVDLFSLPAPSAAEFDERRAEFASVYIDNIRKGGAYPHPRLCKIAGRSISDCEKDIVV